MLTEKQILSAKEAARRLKDISHPTSVKIINWFMVAEKAYVKEAKLALRIKRCWYYMKYLEQAQVLVRVEGTIHPVQYTLNKERLNKLLEIADTIVNY